MVSPPLGEPKTPVDAPRIDNRPRRRILSGETRSCDDPLDIHEKSREERPASSAKAAGLFRRDPRAEANAEGRGPLSATPEIPIDPIDCDADD